MTVQEWLGSDNKLGIDIWTKKYQYENETFNEWLDRISNGNEEVKKLILEKKFLFGGRILSNRGLDKKGVKTTLSNCYVIEPPEDNIESIFDCAKKLARTYSYGGGCGIDISKLAPRGAKVRNTAKETSGSVSFMDLYSLVTGLIGQNGRRGALMISLACDHPDIEEFIEIKSDLERVTKANISIRITDKFMYAVENNEDFVLSFTREETNDTITKTINARSLFHKICEMNWDYAEPGMLFWDRIEGWNLLSNDDDFHYAGTNPCAEEPLPAGGSCLLGSLNLSEFVDENGFNYFKFTEAVDIAVKALNEVLDEGISLHPLQEQRDSVRDWRQIGLGIFGLADMLIKLGVEYGSEKSLALCNEIGYQMANQAIRTSALLAKELGTYPNYKQCAVLESGYLKENASEETIGLVSGYGLHNSQLLTIAPTGSLSSMLGVSGGIEPVYANYYTRKTESLHGHDEYYKVYTPIVERYMNEHNITDDTMLPDFFVTAQDLDYKNRIEMQAIWQKHIDASISSTVNVPNSFTVEETEDLYMSAWKSGLKGVTIFRDGCKRTAILTTDNKSEEKTENNNDANHISELPRGYITDVSDDLIGYKRKITTGCGSVHLEVYSDETNGEPQETFINIGSGGGCERNYQFISRLMSLALRAGVPIEAIIDQAMSIRPCTAYVNRTKSKHDTSAGTSCPSAIGYALKDLMNKINDMRSDDIDEEQESEDNVSVVNAQNSTDNSAIKCPQCGEKLAFEGGCNSCKVCGWSKCDL
jgi:ribonucleoside-diphosphate reductase alpha chain